MFNRVSENIREEPYLSLRTVRRLNVIHDIDMDIVQDYALLCHTRTLPQDATKDDSSLCGGYLDCGLDALETIGTDGVNRRSLNQLEVTEGGEI